jgi:RimJ/RimL family protein N-acetyltransferase
MQGQNLNVQIMISGEKAALGPLRRELLPLYQKWINDFEVNRTLGLSRRPMTLEAETAWYESLVKNESTVAFTIYRVPGLQPVGNCSLMHIDLGNETATFGIVIGEPEAWNQGVGTEVTSLMLGYAFDVLGLHNVSLEVYPHNPAAIRAYEKAGFREVGRRRQAKKFGRRRYDVVIMDAIADDLPPSTLDALMREGQPSTRIQPPENAR